VNPGGTITWTLTIQNNTSNPVTGVDVTDNVPGFGPAMSETFGAPPQPMPIQSVSQTGGFTCNVVDTTDDTQANVICTGGTVPAGGTATITIVQFVAATLDCSFGGNTNGIFTNRARIVAPLNVEDTSADATTVLNDPDSTCAVPTITTTPTRTPSISPTFTISPTTAPAQPNLIVAKTDGDPAPALPGTPTNIRQSVDTSAGTALVTWRLTVMNNGTASSAAGTVVLVDNMPPGFSFASFASVTDTWACTGIGSQTARCVRTGPGALAVGAIAQVDITAGVDTTVTYGDHENLAAAERCTAATAATSPCTTLPQLNPAGHTATAFTTVYPFDLVLVNVNSQPNNVTAPDPTLNYRIRVRNNSVGGHTAPAGWWVTGGLAIRNAAGVTVAGSNVTTNANIVSVVSNHAGDVCAFAAPTAGAAGTVQQYNCRITSLAPGAANDILIDVGVNVTSAAGLTDPPFLGLDATVGNHANRAFGDPFPCIGGGTVPVCAGEFNIGNITGPPTGFAPPATIAANNRDFDTTDVD
jgi:hypothetical protein